MARWLLGKVLVHKFRNRLMTARIVETEAYLRISTSGPWSSTSTIAIIS
jgi:3-methyladenine DNA glycosylase Mpg